MAYVKKLATCCYCGARAVLTLGPSAARRELKCESCGAPMRKLKVIKRAPSAPTPAAPALAAPLERRGPPRRKAKPRRRKSVFARIVEEIIDEIEDVFD